MCVGHFDACGNRILAAGARRGLLMKGGAVIEAASKVQTVVLVTLNSLRLLGSQWNISLGPGK